MQDSLAYLYSLKAARLLWYRDVRFIILWMPVVGLSCQSHDVCVYTDYYLPTKYVPIDPPWISLPSLTLLSKVRKHLTDIVAAFFCTETLLTDFWNRDDSFDWTRKTVGKSRKTSVKIHFPGFKFPKKQQQKNKNKIPLRFRKRKSKMSMAPVVFGSENFLTINVKNKINDFLKYFLINRK